MPAGSTRPPRQEIAELQSVVLDVRRFRSDQGVKPTQRIPARLSGISRYQTELRALLRLTEPDGRFEPDRRAQHRHRRPDRAGPVHRHRRGGRTGSGCRGTWPAARKELDQTGRKLANDAFLANAKPDVVSSIRDSQRGGGRRAAPDRGGAGRAAGRAVTGRRPAGGQRPTGRQLDAERRRTAEAALLARWGEAKISPSRDRIERLLDLLGQPQRSYRTIHLTGTNGKTSTARMIDELLRGFGLRTGRYTSPHLSSHDRADRARRRTGQRSGTCRWLRRDRAVPGPGRRAPPTSR